MDVGSRRRGSSGTHARRSLPRRLGALEGLCALRDARRCAITPAPEPPLRAGGTHAPSRRAGALYTENAEILLPLQKLNDLCQISSTTQRAVSRLLSDTDSAGQLWAATFEAENASRIRARHDRLTATLDAARIGYLPASAGLFVWIDLRPFLDPEILAAQTQTPPPLPPPLAATRLLGPADAAAESELYLRLIREFGLLLTPGASMRTEAAGFFRCVFTAASDEAFDVALERFARLGASPRRR